MISERSRSDLMPPLSCGGRLAELNLFRRNICLRQDVKCFFFFLVVVVVSLAFLLLSLWDNLLRMWRLNSARDDW